MAEEKPNTEQLRAQAALLLSQARDQLAEIERLLAALPSDSPERANISAAAAQISGAIVSLSQALSSNLFPLRSADLAALGGTVASGSAVVTEAAQAVATAALNRAVVTASAATRHEVQNLQHDIFDRHIFDPYLKFTSPEDEEEFRKRETATKRYIDDQLAKGTPEGNLNAAGGLQGQMLDIHAHGAGDSPDFLPRWDALAETTRRQRAAMVAAGQSTEEYDHYMKDSVRRFLKDEGKLSDTEIDKRLAATANPLDAVKPYITSDSAARNLTHRMRYSADASVAPDAASQSGLPTVEVDRVHAPSAPSDSLHSVDAPSGGSTDPQLGVSFAAVAAKLKTSVSNMSEATDPAHGLAVGKPADKTTPAVGG